MYTIWDKHGDEYKRISYFLGEHKRYIGENPPETDRIILPEGPWLKNVPQSIRHKSILYLCINSFYFKEFKNLGYKYAFVKDTKSQKMWGDNSIVVPPLLLDLNKNIVEKDQKVCAVVHAFQARNLNGYNLCKKLNVPVYGYPDNPCNDVPTLLGRTRFLFHPKTMGYLCNVVIKAFQVGTPTIFTQDSYQFGYEDICRDNHNCIVANNEQDILNALNMTCQKYESMQKNIFDTCEKIIETYDAKKIEISKFVTNVR